MQRRIMPIALRLRHASTAVAPPVVSPGITPIAGLRWARRDGAVPAQPPKPNGHTLYINADARTATLENFDMDDICPSTLSEHTHRFDVAFGAEALKLRLALKQFCELKSTNPAVGLTEQASTCLDHCRARLKRRD